MLSCRLAQQFLVRRLSTAPLNCAFNYESRLKAPALTVWNSYSAPENKQPAKHSSTSLHAKSNTLLPELVYNGAASEEASSYEVLTEFPQLTVPLDPSTVYVCQPLCEREPHFDVPAPELLKWRQSARKVAMETGTALSNADGGPDSEELLRELDWLLDDCIAALKTEPADYSEDQAGTSGKSTTNMLKEGKKFAPQLNLAGLELPGGWVPTSWKQAAVMLGGRMEDTTGAANVVSSSGSAEMTKTRFLLRASIKEMERMWQQRISERVPFQYVVGACHWRDLVLLVQPGVLIPRPETELLVDLAVTAVGNDPTLACGWWVDMGTGSGALAIALARAFPDPMRVMAVDKSPIALAVTKANLKRNGVSSRVQLISGDWFEEVGMTGLAGIISNPPYIPSHEVPTLQAEVSRHEPYLALDGGVEDGMDSIRKLCKGAALHLRAGGFLALETNGGDQAKATAELLSRLAVTVLHGNDGKVKAMECVERDAVVAKADCSGEEGAKEEDRAGRRGHCFKDISVVDDLNGMPRFVMAKRC